MKYKWLINKIDSFCRLSSSDMKLISRYRYFILFALILTAFSACHTTEKAAGGKNRSLSEENEKSQKLRTKYAGILGIQPEQINNTRLYAFIDAWTGTPYLYGGKNRNGIDCSGFTEMLYHSVFERDISGSSKDLFIQCRPVPKTQLHEGDLVFFKIESDKISHVGVYLTNNKFVHATVKKGVMISDLSETYYMKYYFEGGRLKEK